MAKARRTYTSAEELALTTQVDGACPKCGDALFYKKKLKGVTRSYKDYEIAHVYPLNPKPEELQELAGVSLLSQDVNDPDNQIPLCTKCHGRFDKPRTRSEYDELYALKKKLIDRQTQRKLLSQYPLDAELRRIIATLYTVEFSTDGSPELSLDPKRLDDKFERDLPGPTRRKIKHLVSDYYQHVRTEFRLLELDVPNSSNLIFTQIKAFYWQQKNLKVPQLEIFGNVVEWIQVATKTPVIEAAEIVAAFFVQNCEVFE